jgi:glycosyltransferase involved in cell wall biosynthesis
MNILFFQGNLYASGYYRLAHPAEEMERQGLAEVNVVSSKDEWRNKDSSQTGWLISKLQKADLVVLQLQNNSFTNAVIPIIRKFNKKIVMDYDDNLFEVPKWNPAYFGLGTEYVDFIVHNKTGEHMNIEANIERQKEMMESTRLADMVTVTGPDLADVYRRFNPNVHILPNSVDFRLIKPCKKSTDGKIRIFWQGSSTHLKDLAEISDVMTDITEKYDNVIWTFWGSGYETVKEIFKGIPEDRIEFIETVPFDEYYDKLNSLTIDIGICPLTDIYYNKCKSNVKWLEYSALKVPAVASKISTYGAIEHGKTGFLAKKYANWMSALSRLIESKELRDSIAQMGYNKVRQDFNIEVNAKLWINKYKTLWH